MTEQQIQEACDKAYKEAGHNAYFGNGFHAVANWALENRWVKCSDMMPDVGLVLGYQNDATYVAFYNGINRPTFNYWMPLPTPPKP